MSTEEAKKKEETYKQLVRAPSLEQPLGCHDNGGSVFAREPKTKRVLLWCWRCARMSVHVGQILSMFL